MIQVNSRYEHKLPQAAPCPPHNCSYPPFPVCFFLLRLTCFVWTVLKNVVSTNTRLNTHIFSAVTLAKPQVLFSQTLKESGGRCERIESSDWNHWSFGKPKLSLSDEVQEKNILDLNVSVKYFESKNTVKHITESVDPHINIQVENRWKVWGERK